MIYHIRQGTILEMLWYEVWYCNIIDWIDGKLSPRENWFTDWYSKIWCNIVLKYEEKDEA